MDEFEARVYDVFRQVFEDEDLAIARESTAAEIEGWDSLMHINLIIAVEKRMGVKFATAEIARLQEEGQNVGTFLDLVRSKLSSA